MPGSRPSLSPRVYSNSMSVQSVIPSRHLILCHPFLHLPSILPSIRDFYNESALSIRWPKYWSFSISPSSEYLGLISFHIYWFIFLVVQRTLKSLLKKKKKKSSVPQLETINSSGSNQTISLLYGSILTTVHDDWKNHSFDYTGLCQQSDASAF